MRFQLRASLAFVRVTAAGAQVRIRSKALQTVSYGFGALLWALGFAFEGAASGISMPSRLRCSRWRRLANEACARGGRGGHDSSRASISASTSSRYSSVKSILSSTHMGR